jgi:hypothetical protein
MVRFSFDEKLKRAHYYHKALWPEFRRWIDGHPYIITDEFDPDTGDNVVRLDSMQPLPPIIAQIFGDCLHNLRAALDHLTFALAIANKPTLTDAEARETQFPIFQSLEGFKARGAGRIRHLSPQAQAIINRLQPYNTGNNTTRHPLWVLQTLENIDKHRRLLVAVGTQGHAIAHPSRDVRMQFLVYTIYSRNMEPKAEIARYRAIDSESRNRVKVDFTPAFNIVILESSFGEAMTADAVLEVVTKHIAVEVLPPLRALL